MVGKGASRQLDVQEDDTNCHLPIKSKSKVTRLATQNPDLITPLDRSNAIVPIGLVNSRVD